MCMGLSFKIVVEELATYELHDLAIGYRKKSRKAETVSVGPCLPATMGLTFNGFLCDLGKK